VSLPLLGSPVSRETAAPHRCMRGRVGAGRGWRAPGPWATGAAGRAVASMVGARAVLDDPHREGRDPGSEGWRNMDHINPRSCKCIKIGNGPALGTASFPWGVITWQLGWAPENFSRGMDTEEHMPTSVGKKYPGNFNPPPP